MWAVPSSGADDKERPWSIWCPGYYEVAGQQVQGLVCMAVPVLRDGYAWREVSQRRHASSYPVVQDLQGGTWEIDRNPLDLGRGNDLLGHHLTFHSCC